MSALQPNIVRTGQASRTAYRVAMLRAVHQLLDDPIVLPDPVALPILGATAQAAVRDDPFGLNDPVARGLRAAVVARSRFVEDELSRCAASGVRQYVVLGAGLDTFAYRSANIGAGLQVFELDHPGTQRWKQQLLAEADICMPPSVTFAPMDFERDGLRETLALAGFRADLPACVSWMGVTAYLTIGAVMNTLRTLAGLAAGSHVYFDYRVPATALGPVDRAVDEFLASQAAKAGEPWLSTFDPDELARQTLALGFATAANVAPDELNARYFARRRDGLCVGGGLRIMSAGTGPHQPSP